MYKVNALELTSPNMHAGGCGAQELYARSCRDLFQPVFVMQPTEHSLAAHSMSSGRPVSMLRLGRRGEKRCWDTVPQIHVNAAVIVMEYPVVENVLQVPLTQGDQGIQAFPANRSNQAFANRICFGRSRRGPQHAHAHRGYGLI